MSIISNKVCSSYNGPFTYDDWDSFHNFNRYGVTLDHHHDLVAARAAAFFSHGAATKVPFVGARTEWKETPEAHVLKAEVPGLKKEELKVEVEEGGCVLCISGEHKFEKEEKLCNGYHVERSSGRFVQRFSLPEEVKANKIKAHMENGVITITTPKRKVNKSPKSVHIF